MAFSNTYDTATPAGSDDPAEADDRMREIKAAIQERLAVEHVFALTGTEVSGANTGKHTDITCNSIVNAGALTNTGNFTLNTDKFTVDAATGNVVVAGTLAVTGVATLGDGSKMATSAAPTADAELANMKYVNDQITAAKYATYESSWAAANAGDTKTVTHNLNSYKLLVEVWTNSSASDAGAKRTDFTWFGQICWPYGVLVSMTDANTLSLAFGSKAIHPDITNGYYKVVIIAIP
jgi:hypothetical protein